MVYYQISWLLFVIKPKWSYLLNADFEDHAEHEYMLLVAEHPEWKDIPFRSDFAADYGSFGSLADLFRQIGHDELFTRKNPSHFLPKSASAESYRDDHWVCALSGRDSCTTPCQALIAFCVTALMTWVVQPRLARVLEGWLYAPRRTR
jgi:hypothetical protein